MTSSNAIALFLDYWCISIAGKLKKVYTFLKRKNMDMWILLLTKRALKIVMCTIAAYRVVF